MKKCELCGYPARICCESDQASLCWDCDDKVHGANFLVAKHVRCLLCHVCQSPTPWKAAGPKFCPTVSVCQICVQNYSEQRPDLGGEETHEEDDCEDYSEFSEKSGDEDEVEEEEDDDDGEEEEEGENQVVPWSCSASPPPPQAASSSCSDGESLNSAVCGGASPLKRIRRNAGLDSDDEIGCCSSQMGSGSSAVNEEASSIGLLRPLKQPRRTSELLNQLQRLEDDGETESRSAASVSTVGRLQRRVINGEDEATSFILGLCKLSRDRSR